MQSLKQDIITGPAMDHLIQDGSHTVHMNNGDQELPSNGVGDVARPMLEPRKAEKRLLTDSSEGRSLHGSFHVRSFYFRPCCPFTGAKTKKPHS
uniref:Uncharacterized protein n=1 Tax=Timema tahoe TaxID=61484 RepID=A0A7R9NW76_9NEOP|nr:unnamed protein product [Timema tahoe]